MPHSVRQRTASRSWLSPPAMEVLEMKLDHRLGNKHLYLLALTSPKFVFEFHLNEIARVAL